MDENLISAYMAGFFDGEGYIGIGKRIHNDRWHEYFVRISIGQKDGHIMDWVKEHFGGHLYKVKAGGSYNWIATNNAAHQILKRIEPFLIYKRPQAVLAIRFREEREDKKRMSPEELKRREELYLQMKV